MKDLSTDADVIARVAFLPTESGGRKSSIPVGMFKCIYVFGGESFDCALLTGQNQFRPGEEAVIPIKFLFPEYVKGHLKPGSRFSLRELNTIAEGEILEVL